MIATFDVQFKRVFERQPNIDFIRNGHLIYGIRFRQLETSFGTLIEWIKDYEQHREKPPKTVRVKEEDISIFISCKSIDEGEANTKHIGRFSIGDDWEGEAFSFVAPIETVMNTIYQRMREYAQNYPMDFSNLLLDDRWTKLPVDSF